MNSHQRQMAISSTKSWLDTQKRTDLLVDFRFWGLHTETPLVTANYRNNKLLKPVLTLTWQPPLGPWQPHTFYGWQHFPTFLLFQKYHINDFQTVSTKPNLGPHAAKPIYWHTGCGGERHRVYPRAPRGLGLLSTAYLASFSYCPSQSYGVSSSHVRMGELDHKEGWGPRNKGFQSVVLEITLESPWDCKETKPVNPKGNQL